MGLAKVSIAALGLVGGASAALQPIVMKGQKFFYENGTQFYMKGIAYQEDVAAGGQGTISDSDSPKDYTDPLSDKKKCDRDIPNLVDLGVNTIRTYAINPDLDHDYCMEKLDKAGIYVISDLSQPKLSINRDDAHWDTELLDRYKGVVDALADYPNVIGFFGGNEVSNNASNTQASAYVKAAIRDTKKHIKDTKKRWLGVGYASNDDEDIRGEIAHYFNCGEQESSIDYWGYNIYSWCGDSDMKTSGYDKQVEFFSNYSVPVFFAEYGCNNQKGGADARTWTDTEALYTDDMTGVFSGGIVYMYFNETNDYGVVQIKDGKDIIMDNFEPLAKAHKAAKPKTIDMDDYKPENARPASCPSISDTWKVSSEALPPVPDSSLCECMVKSRECVPTSDLEAEDFGELFGFVCGVGDKVPAMKDACRAINGEPEVGVYGAYSMCTPKQKLAYVLDAYYKGTNKAADSCKHNGAAELQKAETASSCSSKLKSADDHNKEVAKAPTASDESSSGNGGSGGSSGSGSDDEEPGSFGIRSAPVSLYMAVAMGAGAVMAML